MNLYTATDAEGKTHWVGTQGEAKAINKDFTPVDVPTDKPNLLVFLNKQQLKIDTLKAALRKCQAERQVLAEAAEPVAPPPAPPPPKPIEEPMDKVSLTALPKLVMLAVERTGELGEEAFDAIEAHQAVTGVGAAFSRGVHILQAIAMGDHQFTRVLMQRRKKFGEGKK